MGTTHAKPSNGGMPRGARGARNAQKPYVLALAVLLEKVQPLAPDDRRDFFELFSLLIQCEDDAEHNEILDTMLELVSSAPAVVSEENMLEEGQPDGLTNWMNFVAKNIIELRKQAGLTQSQLSQSRSAPVAHQPLGNSKAQCYSLHTGEDRQSTRGAHLETGSDGSWRVTLAPAFSRGFL
jgi:hypothetical protein